MSVCYCMRPDRDCSKCHAVGKLTYEEELINAGFTKTETKTGIKYSKELPEEIDRAMKIASASNRFKIRSWFF